MALLWNKPLHSASEFKENLIRISQFLTVLLKLLFTRYSSIWFSFLNPFSKSVTHIQLRQKFAASLFHSSLFTNDLHHKLQCVQVNHNHSTKQCALSNGWHQAYGIGRTAGCSQGMPCRRAWLLTEWADSSNSVPSHSSTWYPFQANLIKLISWIAARC